MFPRLSFAFARSVLQLGFRFNAKSRMVPVSPVRAVTDPIIGKMIGLVVCRPSTVIAMKLMSISAVSSR